MTSPLPRTDSATADRIALSFAGSMDATTPCRLWNTVLTSTVTLRECTTEPGLSRWGLAFVGTIRSTYLAPNAVLDLISASRLLGRYLKGSGSIFRLHSDTAPAAPVCVPILVTSPTWTPRNLTFAPSCITSPDLSDTSVRGWYRWGVPEYSSAVSV